MTAQLHQTGYRPFEGTRGSTISAVFALSLDTARRALGLKRKARNKIAPFLSLGIAFVPATVFVGISVLLAQAPGADGPTYAEYMGFIFSALLLFAAFAAPSAICGDLGSDALSLYRTTYLTRAGWILGRLLGVFSVMVISTMGPLLLLLIGYTVLSAGPDGFANWMLVLVRIIASGVVVAAMYSSVAVAISVTTSRRSVASGAIALLFIATPIIQGFSSNPNTVFLMPPIATIEAVLAIFGEPLDFGLSAVKAIGAMALWVVAPVGFLAFWQGRMK